MTWLLFDPCDGSVFVKVGGFLTGTLLFKVGYQIVILEMD